MVRYSKEHTDDVKLSVRSGGHSYTCSSLIPNSIHVDLRDLNSVELIDNEVDDHPHPKETKLLKFGTGNTFEQLLEVADRKKYTFVHGECLTVGVGGYYLHGGVHLSSLTNWYGWGNESIRELEIVTADASVLRFKEPRIRTNGDSLPPKYDREPVQVWKDGVYLSNGSDEYQDLWKAIRVAGSSFGLVTSITVQLFEDPEPLMWGFSLGGLLAKEEELIDLFMEVSTDPDVSLSLLSALGFTNVVAITLKNGSTNKLVNRFQTTAWLGNWFRKRGSYGWRLTRLNSLLSLGLAAIFPPGSDIGGTAYFKDFTASSMMIQFSHANVEEILRWHRGLVEPVKKDCFQVLVPIDAREQELGDLVLYTEFNCKKDHEAMLQQVERDTQKRYPNSFRYRNVPIRMETAEEDLALMPRYFPNHLESLRASKTKYDPGNLFDTFQGIEAL